MMHAKTAVVDGAWSTVGSYNLDHMSLLRNHELAMIVPDAGFGAKMEAMFEADLGCAKEIQRDDGRKRPWRRKLLEELFYSFHLSMWGHGGTIWIRGEVVGRIPAPAPERLMSAATIPVGTTDPINARVLAVSEDQLEGFQHDPFGEIGRRSGLDLAVVLERIQAMLRAGTIRRVRQTLLATNLAEGALVAWRVPQERLDAAFDFMFQQDPFSGHVVFRSADPASPGAQYRLWTTLKVPQGYSLERHCEFLAGQVGAESFRLMPAKALFVLGVGHVRRRGMEPGSRSDEPAEAVFVKHTELSEIEWRVLTALKREFAVDEIVAEPWRARAEEAGVPFGTFVEVAEGLNARGVIGRFSTFLEHVKPVAEGERVTRFNALFHWAVPPGRELEAGRQVGRHHILTHAYWREGGPEFRNVNVMAVAHGIDKELLLAHKRAIDELLASVGVPVSYTNVFWGGRSEIKPSEISPIAYEAFCRAHGLPPESMRA